MYGHKLKGELKKAELEQARLGFIHFLRRKRFSPQFIASNGDDLFATAALEYSRKIAEGTEIESPAGWLITCAWRRTKSLLEAEGRSPGVVSTEKTDLLPDEIGQSPEDAALEDDRSRKVQRAVGCLSVEERRLLELAYFEGMPVREAARELHWHPSKAQRCHEAARRRLQDLLGVESGDELELDVGLAAYASLVGAGASTSGVGRRIEALAETASHVATSGWARAQEMARRLPLGGTDSPAAATLGGGAGRAVGVCATAALACLASGVVGPGVGGVNLIGGSNQDQPQPKSRSVAAAPRPPAQAPVPHITLPTSSNKAGGGSSSNRRRDANAGDPSQTARQRRATRAVRTQTLESAAGSPEEASSVPVGPPPAEASSAPAPEPGGASSATPTQSANEQFGP